MERKDYKRNYYLKNKEKIIAKSIKWREENEEKAKLIANSEKTKDRIEKYRKEKKEEIKVSRDLYYKENKDKINQESKEWREKNKEHVKAYKKEYEKKRKELDPLYKSKMAIRKNISNAFNRQGYKKNSRTEQILGCSFDELKLHLESKFENWMTWDNYGKYDKNILNYGWDIDHIITTSSATTEEELIQLNHFSNLQPLCSKTNRDIKKNSLIWKKDLDI